jgi:microcompartment protein CcmK/EutM
LIFAEVLGTVVATRKDPQLRGFKFLMVREVDFERTPTGAYLVAADAVGAGAGEFVLVASGSSARMTELTKDRPVDAVIMAIVDTVEIEGRVVFEKYPSGAS